MPDPNSIRIKRSNTSTNVPASLLNGELAANSSDQKLWIGNSSNTPILLSDITNTFVNQGAWNSNTTYTKNMVVTYSGIFYYSVSAVPAYSTTPDVNPTYWSVLSNPDQTVSLTQGTDISITGTYPNLTIGYSGTPGGVTSVTAGTGISVDVTTGAITITNSAPAQTVTLSGDVTGSGTTAITTTLATVPIAKGGTGQTTANAAINALLPSQISNTGKYLTSNGTDSSWGAIVGGPSFTASATAPASPVSGDRWFDTSIGVYFTYVNDGTSSQWVETSNSGTTVNAIIENLQTIDTNKTITASCNGTSLGPITINTAVTVTLGNAQRWIIL